VGASVSISGKCDSGHAGGVFAFHRADPTVASAAAFSHWVARSKRFFEACHVAFAIH
jgi:hypothetical protein